MPELLKEFNRLPGRLLWNAPMSRYTTMRIGGHALGLYEPRSLDDLRQIIRLCEEKNIPAQVIGNGSNIIVDDAGIEKMIIRLVSPFFRRIIVDGSRLICGAGVGLNRLCIEAENSSLSGCEFLVGIPGTVGGAVFQNAGACNRSVSDIIKDVKVLDRYGKETVLAASEAGFGYRFSRLKDFIIISATFELVKMNRQRIMSNITRHIKMRLNLQDYTAPSAGCIFKNPGISGLSAGMMIDACGLKGKRIGGASVSRRHANFIINNRGAKAEDVLRLIDIIKEQVKKKYDVSLEEEVEVMR